MLFTIFSSMALTKRRMMMQIFPASWRNFWDNWVLRVMVLASLSIQTFLMLLGNKRKYSNRTCLRIALWSAYMLADWLATISLNVLSNKVGENEGDSVEPKYVIMGLWAPLLLLHLGGPDTITAYSMEDNELWTRHFFSFAVQVGVAVYIFLRSWTNAVLNIWTIPIFVAGIIKIGERIWVLWSASSQQFRESLFPAPDPGISRGIYNAEVKEVWIDAVGVNSKYSNDEEDDITSSDAGDDITSLPKTDEAHGPAKIENIAHRFLKISKLLFADLILSVQDVYESRSCLQNESGKDAFEVMEVELGFVYDLFYTKAAVIYSVTGTVFRFVTLSCNIAVLFAFFFIEKNQYPKVDVVITSVLLLGAVILEIYSVISLLPSDWTMLWLSKHKNKVTSKAISSFQVVKSKRWSGSIGQFNLLSFCSLGSFKKKAAKYPLARTIIGVWRSYQKFKNCDTKTVSDDLKEIIFKHFIDKIEEVKMKNEGKKGEKLEKKIRGLYDHWKDGMGRRWQVCNDLCWNRIESFDESILALHIATDLCYYSFSGEEGTSNDSTSNYREASKVLSEYMLYLLVMRPSMLPNGIGEIRFQDTCADVTEFVTRYGQSTKRGEEACQKVLPQIISEGELDDLLKVEGDISKSVLYQAHDLAGHIKIEDLDPEKMWEAITEAWIGMLAYAAIHCQGIHHAQHLRHGGELLTHVWLLMTHLGITDRVQIPRVCKRVKWIRKRMNLDVS